MAAHGSRVTQEIKPVATSFPAGFLLELSWGKKPPGNRLAPTGPTPLPRGGWRLSPAVSPSVVDGVPSNPECGSRCRPIRVIARPRGLDPVTNWSVGRTPSGSQANRFRPPANRAGHEHTRRGSIQTPARSPSSRRHVRGTQARARRDPRPRHGSPRLGERGILDVPDQHPLSA